MSSVDKVFAALIGLALVATLVSSHAKTASALQTAFGALISLVKTVMSPLQKAS